MCAILKRIKTKTKTNYQTVAGLLSLVHTIYQLCVCANQKEVYLKETKRKKISNSIQLAGVICVLFFCSFFFRGGRPSSMSSKSNLVLKMFLKSVWEKWQLLHMWVFTQSIYKIIIIFRKIIRICSSESILMLSSYSWI